MKGPVMVAGALLAAAMSATMASAFPNMEEAVSQASKRTWEPSTALIGDLAVLPNWRLTRTGRNIKRILQGRDDGQDLNSRYNHPPPLNSRACARDRCCVWKYIADEMQRAMLGPGGQCNNVSRTALRLGFHDAGTWSRRTGKKGGANGSVVLAGECEDRTRFENQGLGEICALMRTWFDKYKRYGISMADLIQMGANVGTVMCPLAPRVRTFVGRRDSNEAGPKGLIPTPFDTADQLISNFEEKTFTATGLVALLGSHTTSRQRFAIPERANGPQDSTPGVWDTRYFRETLSDRAPREVVKLPSDINLSRDPRVRRTWEAFGDSRRGHFIWSQIYAKEYVRMSMLGVSNMNEMTECTKVLPPPKRSYSIWDGHRWRSP